MTLMELQNLDRPFATCEWLHAPLFRDWLESEGVEPGHLELSEQRQWAGWGLDAMSITVALADQICTRLGLHLSMIPDEVWDTAKKGRRWQRHTANDHKQARMLRHKGYTVRQIAALMGISSRTVHKWIKDIRTGPSTLKPKLVAKWIMDNIPQDERFGDKRLDSALTRWGKARNVPKASNVASMLGKYGKTLDDLPSKCWERGK